ncbi:MAG: TetR/AcrR family transcriptional regulator [Pyrinomonadaceae bacterium]
MRERRERQKEELRQEILDAAREMFFEEGYENVSMRKLAERIEYSPTTIYLHFKDKAELFNQLCDESFAKLALRLEKLQKRLSRDPLAFLREGLRAYIDFGLKHPHHYAVTFILAPTRGDDYQFQGSAGERAFSYMRGAVALCVAKGELQTADIDATAQAIWASIHGVTSLLITHKDFPFVPKNKLIEETIEMIVRGLQTR